MKEHFFKQRKTMTSSFEYFNKQLIDQGFKYCSDSPATYVRIDKDLSTKLFVFIYEGNNGMTIKQIVFSLRLGTPSNIITAYEEFEPILFWNMTHRSDWYETIIGRLCQKINQIFYDTLSKPKKQDQE